MFVQCPNGTVLDVIDTIATGLVDDGEQGYQFVDAPKATAKRGRPPVKK